MKPPTTLSAFVALPPLAVALIGIAPTSGIDVDAL
jgi:hypothetical protein